MQYALTAFEGSAAPLLESLGLLSGRDRVFQARLADASSPSTRHAWRRRWRSGSCRRRGR